jgi:hypothetical protein
MHKKTMIYEAEARANQLTATNQKKCWLCYDGPAVASRFSQKLTNSALGSAVELNSTSTTPYHRIRW